jgi:hypothetical protein
VDHPGHGVWTISSGDHIYFRRGDTFRGEIYFSAYNNSGITFDAYGSGADPIIKVLKSLQDGLNIAVIFGKLPSPHQFIWCLLMDCTTIS